MHTMHKHIVIPKPTHGSLEWLQLRHRNSNGDCIVGASEVATVMGDNPYQSIADLAVKKTLDPVVGEQNEAMVRGNALEPALLAHASNVLGKRIETPEFMFARGRIVATLDGQGVDEPDLIVEAKTTNSWSPDAPFPKSWFWQAQAQMYCTGAPEVIFIILDRHQRFIFQTIEADRQAQDAMWDKVEAFCSAIDRGEIPEEDTLSAPAVAELHPEPAGETELDTNAITILAQWQGIRESISLMEKEEKQLRDALARTLMGKEYGTVAGRRVISWKAQESRRLDQKALAEAHPDIAEQFMKTSHFRVMRATK